MADDPHHQNELYPNDSMGRPVQDPADQSDAGAASQDDPQTAVQSEATPKKRKRGSSFSAGDDKKVSYYKRRRILNKLSDDEKAKIVKDLRAEVKAEFESSRDELLQNLPEDYKNFFGEIGFSKWSGKIYACIIVSPYQIPPSEARHKFYQHYEELKEKGRLGDLPFLIYYYGEQNVNSQYSFIAKSNFTPFEEGRNKKTHFLALLESRKKKEANKKLSKQDEYNLRALHEVEEDLSRDRSDRKRNDFPEEYDLLTDAELLKEYVEEYGSNSDEESESSNEAESEVVPSVAAKKGAGTKRRKVVSVNVKTKKTIVPDEEKSDVGVDDEEKANLKYALEDSDEVDDHSSDRGWQGRDTLDDEEDMGFTSDILYKSNFEKKKKVDEASRKTEKRKLNPMKNEMREFKRCEKHYLPFVQEWKKAFELRDLFALESCFERANAIVKDCSAPFLEAYFPVLVKKTKSFLRDSSGNDVLLKSIKAVGKKLQEVYDEKKKHVPPGFKAPEKKLISDSAELRVSTTSIALPFDRQPEPRTARSLSPVRVPSNELDTARPSRMSDSFQPTSQRLVDLNPTQLKSERKSFSLGKLKTRFEAQQPSSTSNPGANSTKTSRYPAWTTEEVTSTHINDSDRALGFDFLLDMASHFPPDKVNAKSIAGTLEEAVYEWAQKISVIMGESESAVKKPWADLYWQRIHALITAVCGQHGTGSGTLMHLIMNGHFTSAESLATISDEQLLKASNGSFFSID